MKIDGLDNLKNLFESDDDFINHFIESVFFFDLETIISQSQEVINNIKTYNKIPIRYSEKFKSLFKVDSEFIDDFNKIENKKTAVAFSKNHSIFHNETGITIIVDPDNSNYVRRAIKSNTGYKVSAGKHSDIQNYTISHVWGQTDNPLFFSLLWNVTLIPTYLGFILDKPDHIELIKKLKLIMKAICFELYDPNKLMNSNLVNKPSKEIHNLSIKFINDGKIKFLPKKETKKKPRKNNNKHSKTEYMKVGKFIKTKMEKLFKEKKLTNEMIKNLLSVEYSKRIFIIGSNQIAMLKEITFDKNSNSSEKEQFNEQITIANVKRYYARYIDYKGKKYAICSQWYEIRNHRYHFINWLDSLEQKKVEKTDISNEEEKIRNQISRVERKIPNWFEKPDQISTRILINYMELLGNNEYVEYSALENRCSNIASFISNFGMMKSFARNNSAKVFEKERNDSRIYLWKPVREFVINEYRRYLESTR